MKTLLAFVGLLLALTAQSAVVVPPISGYPNTNIVQPSDLFLLAVTNQVPRTNKNILYRDLLAQISNAIPVTTIYTNSVISNQTTIITNLGGGSLWTNIAGYLMPLNGGTNTLRVDTNLNRGIFIGDTNIAAVYFGWPSDGQTYLSVLPGTNRWGHGTLQLTTTNGSYATITSQSGGNPILTEAFVVLTNGVIASEFDINMQRTGSYLLLGGNVNDGFVGIQSGAQLSTPIGGNLIRAKWGGTDRWFLATNGAVSFFGSATNYGVLYAKSNFIVSGTTLLQSTLGVNGAALFLNGLGSTGITNTIGFQTLGRINLGDDPSDLTTSSNLFRQYGPMHIHDDLFMQDIGVSANKIMYLTAGRQVATSATVDPTELGFIDGVTSSIQAQIDAISAGSTAYEVLTNGVRVALGTNVNWTTGVTGYVSGSTLNLGVNVSGGGGGGSTMWTNQSDLSILRPIAGSTNFIGGGTGNVIATNNSYSTVSGGQANEIRSNATYAAIGGGLQNIIAPFSIAPTISGGRQNTASTNYVSIGGGFQNTASGRYTSIGGGFQNTALKEASFIGGGDNNQADGAQATIGGGFQNTIALNGTDGRGTIGGGYQNSVGQDFGVVAGGAFNVNGLAKSAIGGGFANFITGNAASGNTGHAVIGGGQSNRVGFTDGITASKWGTIAGGSHNWIRERGEYSTIGGGLFNQIEGGLGLGGTIAGGMSNLTLTGSSAVTVGGGVANLIAGGASFATIAGGTNNSIGASAMDATISGGENNEIGASSIYTTIAGGLNNTIQNSDNGATISGGNGNTIQQNSQQSVIVGGANNLIGSNSIYSAILGGAGNTIKSNTPYAFVIGTTTTVSNANALTVSFTNTTGVVIDVTNLHLIGNMQILMTNESGEGKVFTSDSLGRGRWSGGGGGGGVGATYINTSNGFGTNTFFVGTITNLGAVYGSNFIDRSNAKWWGAIPNDAIDDATAIQNAISYASTVGGTVTLPAGTNLYGRTLYLKSNVRLVGEAGAILARVPGMHDSRPLDQLSTNAGLITTLMAVSRYYYTTGTYTNTATPVPDASYAGPHSNIYVGNLTIYGARKLSGNLHQIASGATVLGDINDVDALTLDDCSDAMVENVTVPFASEHAVSVLGNTDLQEGGSGRNIRIVNLTAVDVGMLVEAQEGVQDLTAINPVGTQVYIHGMRMSGVRFSKVLGGSIGPCPTGNALYYASTGTHLAFGVNLTKTNTADLAVRIDGGTEHVTLIGNTIHQGQIGRSFGTSGVVIIQANHWLNKDARKQVDQTGFIHDSTGFIQLPETRVLIIDETLPTSTNNADYTHFIYSATNRIIKPHSQSATMFDNEVLISSNGVVVGNGSVGIGTNAPSSPLHLRPVASGQSYLRVDDTNGTPRLQFGVYPGAPQYGTLWLGNVTPSGANLAITSDGIDTTLNGSSSLTFASGAGNSRWVINSSGHLVAAVDNTYDIGAGGATRPRSGYFGTSLTSPVANIRTNLGTMDVTTNLFVLGTRVTNGTRRIFVGASAQLSAAAAGTAKVTLYVENAGSATNRLSISAGPLASLITVEPLFMAVSPGSIYYFADETSGVGATASLLPETCSVTAF